MNGRLGHHRSGIRMSFDRVLRPILTEFKARQPMRAKSLIITLFGDVVSQHEKEIWLGSVSEALRDLGISDRLVRTSVFRLVSEGWLDGGREGRRSFYRFSAFGSQEYQRAAQRIYSITSDPWRGRWQLLFPTDVPDTLRDDLRRSLHWLGFRAISPGAYARPGGDLGSVRDLLDEFSLEKGVIVMDGVSSPVTAKNELKRTVNKHWELDKLAEDYALLIKRFRPLNQVLEKGTSPAPAEAFLARLLLIHDYRRILLRDTPLPDDLLPSRWSGTIAKHLVGALYRQLTAPSLLYIRERLMNQRGPLPSPNRLFFERFADQGDC